MTAENTEQPNTAQETIPAASLPNPSPSPRKNTTLLVAVAVISALTATLITAAVTRSSSTLERAADPFQVIASLPNGLNPTKEMTSDARLAGPYFGKVILRAGDGISDNAGTAPAWIITTRDLDRARFLTTLAKLVGAQGPPVDDGWSTTIGNTDGSGANVWLSNEPTGNFGGYNPQRSPWGCLYPQPMPAPEPPTGSGRDSNNTRDSFQNTVPGFSPDNGCAPDPTSAPAPAQARRIAQDALEALGLIGAGVELVVTPNDRSVTVTAVRSVEGYQIPWTTTIEISATGIHSVYGVAGKPARLPDYPVVGAVTAAARSLDPYFSTLGPIPLWDVSYPGLLTKEEEVSVHNDSTVTTKTAETVPTGRELVTRPPRLIEGRPVLDAVVQSVEVTKARLGIGQFILSDGSIVLLPTWEYTDTDNNRWSMLAVETRYVNFTPAG